MVKKIVKITLFVLLGVVVIGTFYYLWKKSQPVEVVYGTIAPSYDTIMKRTVATGKIEPRDEILIKPQISGIVSEVRVEAGDFVKVGDIIATVKVVPEIGSLNSAESSLNNAKVSLTKSQQNYDRVKGLRKSGVVSQEDWELAEAEYERAKIDVENAQNSLEIIRDGISKKFAQYSNTQIRSTIAGMILDVPVKVGSSVIQANTFNEGTTIATVADMGQLIFKGKIDETEVGKIAVGMPVKITIGALQDKKFDAVLEYVSPKGTEESGAVLFEIKAAVQVPKEVFIRAGYSANAEIILERSENVLTLPESTIEFKNDSSFVYILKSSTPKQTFDKKMVTLGLSDGVKIEVKSGVDTTNLIRN